MIQKIKNEINLCRLFNFYLKKNHFFQFMGILFSYLTVHLKYYFTLALERLTCKWKTRSPNKHENFPRKITANFPPRIFQAQLVPHKVHFPARNKDSTTKVGPISNLARFSLTPANYRIKVYFSVSDSWKFSFKPFDFSISCVLYKCWLSRDL